MDVFDRVMQISNDNNLKPSKELYQAYEKSEITKILNEIPSYMYLRDKIGITLDDYDKLKER